MKETTDVRQHLLALFAIAVAVLITLSPSNVFSQSRPGKTETVELIAKGPGALFIAPLKDGVGFWILSRGVARPVQYVRNRGGYNKDYRIQLTSGIGAVVFADDLDLSQISFTGKPESPDCPNCTVTMPLELRTPISQRDDRYFEQILNVENQLATKVEKYENLGLQMQLLFHGKRIQRPR